MTTRSDSTEAQEPVAAKVMTMGAASQIASTGQSTRSGGANQRLPAARFHSTYPARRSTAATSPPKARRPSNVTSAPVAEP